MEHPVLMLSARAGHSVEHGHIKVSLYIPDLPEYRLLTQTLDSYIAQREMDQSITIKGDRLRRFGQGVLLDINVIARSWLEGFASIFLPGMSAVVTTDDDDAKGIRAITALPITLEELDTVVDALYGQGHDYHLLATVAKGNNCMSLTRRAMEAADIGLFAALGIEATRFPMMDLERPQKLANAIKERLKQTKGEQTLLNPIADVTFTFAEHHDSTLLGRPFWLGHSQSHRHAPLRDLLEAV